MWGIFSSPCQGVVWDSGRHCWDAQPVNDDAAAPQHFAPAVLGMEGAKSEAIKCRRAMELEAGVCVSLEEPQSQMQQRQGQERRLPASPSVSTRTGQAKTSATAVGTYGARRGGLDSAKYLGYARPKSPNRLPSPNPSPVRPRSPLASPGDKQGAVASNGQRLSSRTTSAPRLARTAQPRQAAAGRAAAAGGGSREGSPSVTGHRDVRPSTGREVSPAPGVSRRTYSPLTGRREPVQGEVKPRVLTRRDVGRPAVQDRRRKEEQGDRSLPNQVMQQLAEFQSKLEQMQEEASRERSEKEALRKSNQRLQMQVDKLLKIAASRTAVAAAAAAAAPRPGEPLDSSKSDPVADAEAFLERRIAALENPQASASVSSTMSTMLGEASEGGDFPQMHGLVDGATSGLAAAKRIAAAAASMASMAATVYPPPTPWEASNGSFEPPVRTLQSSLITRTSGLQTSKLDEADVPTSGRAVRAISTPDSLLVPEGYPAYTAGTVL